jgi:hypothetical protein
MTTIGKHEDIIAWQLGQEISRRVAEILSRSPAEIANGSLGETSTRIRQGFPRGFFTEREFNERPDSVSTEGPESVSS